MIFFFRITHSANVNWCLWFITSSTGNRLKQSIQFLECERLYSDFKYPVEVYSISVHNVHPLLNKRVNINRKKLNSWCIFIDKAHRSPSTWEGFEGCRERTRNERIWCLVHVDLTQLVINLDCTRGAFKKQWILIYTYWKLYQSGLRYNPGISLSNTLSHLLFPKCLLRPKSSIQQFQRMRNKKVWSVSPLAKIHV